MSKNYCTPLIFLCSDQEHISYPASRLKWACGTVRDFLEISLSSSENDNTVSYPEFPIQYDSAAMTTFLDFLEAGQAPVSDELEKVKSICEVANFLDLSEFPAICFPTPVTVFQMVRHLFSQQPGLKTIRHPITVSRKGEAQVKIDISTWEGALLAIEYQDELLALERH